MSLFAHYLKTIQSARSHVVLDAIQSPLRREWHRFSDHEKAHLFEAGKTQREKLTQAPTPEESDPFDDPSQSLFRELVSSYQNTKTQEEVRVVRARVDGLVLVSQLQQWQSRELFVEDIAALRRIWLETAAKVSETTQQYLDRLGACETRAAFDALLLEVLPYSLELERQDKSEWWVLEHAFEVRSCELRSNPKIVLKKLL
jgi:hypothetical protein